MDGEGTMMATKQAKRDVQRTCPKCKRPVSVLPDGKLATHGPGPTGDFVCQGSGDAGMVKAGKFKT